MTLANGARDRHAARPVKISLDYTKHAEGSVLIECGDTHVICTASVEDKVPPFLRGKEMGWVTAEYGMLPRSTTARMTREASRGRLSGRTQEIQRLIGRSLRSVVDLRQLGERTLWLDCDVIQADGGTRTASITGAFVAMALAVHKLLQDGIVENSPLLNFVAAVSVGIVNGAPQLDLSYEQDSNAEVDMNIVMTGDRRFVEVQGTAERRAFNRGQLDELLNLAEAGITDLIALQKEALRNRLGSLDHLFPPQACHDAESAAGHHQ